MRRYKDKKSKINIVNNIFATLINTLFIVHACVCCWLYAVTGTQMITITISVCTTIITQRLLLLQFL